MSRGLVRARRRNRGARRATARRGGRPRPRRGFCFRAQSAALRGGGERRAALFPRRLRAHATPLVLVRRHGSLQAVAAAAVLSCALAPVPPFDRAVAAELRHAGRSVERAQAYPQLAGGRSHRDLRRSGLRSGGAHAPRPNPAAEAIPAQRADEPRPTARLAVEAVYRAFATPAPA